MSFISCFSAPKSTLTEGAHACLNAVVEKVRETYRGPAKCLLINDAGELEFESDCGGGGDDVGGPGGGSLTTMQFDVRTLENLCVLKRASLQMADGLSMRSGMSGSTPAMHLKSNDNVVSCFDVGDRGHIFVVLAEMHTSSVELLDTSGGPGGVDTQLRDCLAALAAVL